VVIKINHLHFHPSIENKKAAACGFFVRWVGVEPTRLAAHGPQPCLSANSSTSANVLVL
jgi:hypothetical protein